MVQCPKKGDRVAYLLPSSRSISASVVVSVSNNSSKWCVTVIGESSETVNVTATGYNGSAIYLGLCASDEQTRTVVDCLACIPFPSEGAITRNLCKRIEHSSSFVYSFVGLPEAIIGAPNSTLISVNPHHFTPGFNLASVNILYGSAMCQKYHSHDASLGIDDAGVSSNDILSSPASATVSLARDCVGTSASPGRTRGNSKAGEERLRPHIYSVAEAAYRSVISSNDTRTKSESRVIVSMGTSGSGKTFNTRKALEHVIQISSSQLVGGTPVKIGVAAGRRLLRGGTVILDAFSNIISSSNPSGSSMATVVYQLNLDSSTGALNGANLDADLFGSDAVANLHLKGNRCRNFDIFYMLIRGSTAANSRRYRLRGIAEYRYLNPLWKNAVTVGVDCIRLSDVGEIQRRCDRNEPVEVMTDVLGRDDAELYEVLLDAFLLSGFSSSDQDEIFRMLSAILLLGNVHINSLGSAPHSVTIDDNEDLIDCAALLNVSSDGLISALLCVPSHLKNESPLQYARNIRDAMACSLYHYLFCFVVAKVREGLSVQSTARVASGKTTIIPFESTISFVDAPATKSSTLADDNPPQTIAGVCADRIRAHWERWTFDKEVRKYNRIGFGPQNADELLGNFDTISNPRFCGFADDFASGAKAISDISSSSTAFVPAMFQHLENSRVIVATSDLFGMWLSSAADIRRLKFGDISLPFGSLSFMSRLETLLFDALQCSFVLCLVAFSPGGHKLSGKPSPDHVDVYCQLREYGIAREVHCRKQHRLFTEEMFIRRYACIDNHVDPVNLKTLITTLCRHPAIASIVQDSSDALMNGFGFVYCRGDIGEALELARLEKYAKDRHPVMSKASPRNVESQDEVNSKNSFSGDEQMSKADPVSRSNKNIEGPCGYMNGYYKCDCESYEKPPEGTQGRAASKCVCCGHNTMYHEENHTAVRDKQRHQNDAAERLHAADRRRTEHIERLRMEVVAEDLRKLSNPEICPGTKALRQGAPSITERWYEETARKGKKIAMVKREMEMEVDKSMVGNGITKRGQMAMSRILDPSRRQRMASNGDSDVSSRLRALELLAESNNDVEPVTSDNVERSPSVVSGSLSMSSWAVVSEMEPNDHASAHAQGELWEDDGLRNHGYSFKPTTSCMSAKMYSHRPGANLPAYERMWMEKEIQSRSKAEAMQRKQEMEVRQASKKHHFASTTEAIDRLYSSGLEKRRQRAAERRSHFESAINTRDPLTNVIRVNPPPSFFDVPTKSKSMGSVRKVSPPRQRTKVVDKMLSTKSNNNRLAWSP